MKAELLLQFEQQIALKKQSYSAAQRELINKVLDEKYKALSVSEKLKSNLNRLKEATTFTVTTGHQLCLMTGPLYFIYKILHVIKLSEELNNTFPNQHFVPVYWMASEDHDFEEIKSFQLFGQKLTWESSQKGAVGRFNTSDLTPLISEISQKFQSHPQSEIHRLLNLLKAPTYADGFFKFIHTLFSSYGLVIIDADEPAFKHSAWPIWEKDLFSTDFHQAVVENTQQLQENDLPTPIESKESNLFMLSDQKRERIEKTGQIQFEKEHSVQLSPNVVLRPIYQEWILPNLAYVGGPSEIAYWQQLPLAFTTLDIPFPLTLKRAGGILIQQKDLELIQKLGFEKHDFLANVTELKKQYLEQQGDQTPDYSQQQQLWTQYKTAFLNLAQQAFPQEHRTVEAELTRLHKQIEALEEKFEKARKAQFERVLKQIDQLADKIQPKGQLQERTLNILQFCPDGEIAVRIAQIYAQFDPFSQEKQWFVAS